MMETISPAKMKIEARRNRVWSLYLQGHTQEEIAEREAVDRTTVYRDIQAFNSRISELTSTVEIVYKDAYDRLLAQIKEIQRRAEIAEKDGDAAKLWKVAAIYDRLLLDRFMPKQDHDMVKQENERLIKQMKCMIDFLVEKMGLESLDNFEEYWLTRANLEKWH